MGRGKAILRSLLAGAITTLVLVPAGLVGAASTNRVKDIYPGPDPSSPLEHTTMKLGNRQVLFFTADDGTSGRELWRSNGKPGGTKRVKDIYPGPEDSDPYGFTVMKVGKKQVLFFQATDGTSGNELWRSDGTATGTRRVRDINPGGDSYPQNLATMKLGNRQVLFFTADDGTSGFELWRSDGTSGGTKRVKDINPGMEGSYAHGMVAMKVGKKRVLFFTADDGTSGFELWRSDGTSVGTRRVKDISSEPGGSDPRSLTVMQAGGKPVLFFQANDGTSGYELWRSNGRSGGTRRVKDIHPGPASSDPYDLTVMKLGQKEVLFFSATDGTSGYELWRSNGTQGGTNRVKDINPVDNSDPEELTTMRVGKKHALFFRADDGTSGTELWRSDGRAEGTRRVKDINPGPGASYPNGMQVGKKQVLFFTAYDPASGWELWRSNGRAGGTNRAADINPTGDSLPYGLTQMRVGKKPALLFAADDGTSGYELWRHRP